MDPMKTTNLVSAMFLSALGFVAIVSAADGAADEHAAVSINIATGSNNRERIMNPLRAGF